MSDALAADAPPAPRGSDAAQQTAGSLLRQARQAQGLHIAALAAAIKVAPRKLDMLESDRFDELPDATFTRALAQTVCRTLKIDPEPVLAKLPQPQQVHRLEQVTRGLNEPFRDRNSRRESFEWSTVLRPAVWGPVLLVLAAAVVYLVPPGVWHLPGLGKLGGGERAPAAEGPTTVTTSLPASAPAMAVAAPVDDTAPVASATMEPARPAADAGAAATSAAAAAPVPAASAPVGPLLLRASGDSWVEVRDAGGRVLLSRMLQAGEAVGLDGALPLRATIGNAGGTQVSFRGKPVELAAFTRDNVAKLELK